MGTEECPQNKTGDGKLQYDPGTEIHVLQVVKEEGEADRARILSELGKRFSIVVDDKSLLRYLFRWKARKVLTIRTRNGEEVWAIAEVPPWFDSAMMDVLAKTTVDDMRVEIEALNERLKGADMIVDTPGKWGNYTTYDMTFENLDPILGGRPTDEERELQLVKYGDKIIIPTGWFRGWFRDNQALMDVRGLQYWTAWGVGEFPEPPKLEKYKLKVKVGLATYEGFPPGNKFKVMLRFPFRGSKIKTPEDLKMFLDKLATAPIRGFGAYSHAYGGRIKVVEMKPV